MHGDIAPWLQHSGVWRHADVVAAPLCRGAAPKCNISESKPAMTCITQERKLMKRIGILALALAALSLGGCNFELFGIRGNGHVVTDQRSISDFSEISASGGLRIEWRSGPPSLSITTDENLLQYIYSHVEDSKLRLRTRERLRPTDHIRVTITTQKLLGAQLSGAVDLVAHNLTGPKFYVRGTGACDVTLDGAVDELLADFTGAGDLRAKSLQVKTAEVSATGAADAVVNVSDVLRVSVTGAGDVVYYGNPKTLENHVVGAGSVNHRE